MPTSHKASQLTSPPAKAHFFHFMNALSPDVVTLGNLFADILKKSLNLDIMPNLVECFPYDAAVTMITVTGAQLRRMLLHMLRDEVWQGAHCEFYQLSKGMRVVYDRQKHEFLELRFEGEQVRDDLCYTVGMPCLSHFCVWADNSLFALTEIGRSSKMII